MTEQDPPEAAQEIWRFDDHPGYRRSIESAGSVAAPLLAGFAFTLLALMVPTLGDHAGIALSGKGIAFSSQSPSLSGLPELAAVCLLLSGLAFVFSVQAAIQVKFHNHRPSEIIELYPEYFPKDPSEQPAIASALPEWHSEEWPALQVGEQWYGGWPRRFLHEEWQRAQVNAHRMRWLYHLGILALLVGLTALVWPPSDAKSTGRWLLVGLGATGVLIESAWIAIPTFRDRRDQKY